ncbi:MAG: 2-oxoglutarate dehydrogenase complex dihydrolipoyllysine-residue succinyltransferase [Verrucomicrobia bacterium]|nr:2-oxoglutarate dehydrogenase complex dihydrolipoyllysine-residue succinyltransferase [Verrucomicrobiota bacterium]
MSIELKVPAVGESISEVEIGEWLKQEGDFVEKDENIAVIETEKATVEIPAPVAGTLTNLKKKKGETAKVGEVIAHIEEGKGAPAPAKVAKGAGVESAAAKGKEPAEKTEAKVMPAAQRVMAEKGLKAEQITATGPGGRVLKEDAMRGAEPAPAAAKQPASVEAVAPKIESSQPAPGFRQEQAVRMTKLRRTVAERLVQAQHTAALLTTFNEIDMTNIMTMRKEYGEAFVKRYGLKLGFMSFFVKAVVDALKQTPEINAEIRGEDIIYKNYYDIGVAIGGGKGLVVPVLRNTERMSFADIEKAIAEFAVRARDNKLKIEELQGGTFTISNGGIYGSLLSTPIINPPQSGVLGMHTIQERPIALNGQVVIRPMMYVALTYDHRIVDGKEAVTFLKRIKEAVEAPARMLLEV